MTLDPRRAGCLTASNFGAAIGVCAYKSRQKLWREVCGFDPPFEGNDATQWGNDHEADNLHSYEVQTGEVVERDGPNQRFVIHPEHSWLGCTPDGFPGEGMIECKSPFSGNICGPERYMPQVQGQLEICRKPWCDLSIWTPEKCVITRIYRNPSYWAWMFPLLQNFWNAVQSGQEPKRAKKPTPPAWELAA